MVHDEAPAGAAPPVRFSLSMVVESHRRPAPWPHRPQSADPETVVEYVASVDTEAGFAVENPRAETVRVVPKLEDSWPSKNRVQDIVIARSMEEAFEMETKDAKPNLNTVYGLSVMRSGEVRHKSLKELEDQKLRHDLMNLPEQATLEKYEELPVEEFGEALLRGMGWEKGKPIGRNATAVVAPVECVKRQCTLGLGAVPAPRRASRARKVAR